MNANNVKHLSHEDVNLLALELGTQIRAWGASLPTIKAYPVPRGGIPVAYLLKSYVPFLEIVSNPEEADCFIDDLIDSGATCERLCNDYPDKPFFALLDKREATQQFWIVFPWEHSEEGSFEDNVVRLLQFVGEDPMRGGLLETPKRVAKAWRHWCSGYGKDPKEYLKTFEDGAENCDEMIVRVVPVYSHCEHHMAAIIGTAVVAYIPNGRVVGLSKIDRVVDIFARRLQVQERLTNQIAQAIMDNMAPKGVAVWINARHLCVESRGVQNHTSQTDTLALRGVFKDDPRTRAEFVAVAQNKFK